MKFSDVLKNPHFNNIAAIIRVVSLSQNWRNRHQVPLWTRLDELDKLKEKPDLSHFVQGFCAFLVELTSADPQLSYTEEDLQWFIEMCDNREAKAIISLLFAWASAPDTLLTPVEVAEATGTAESTWRNKAAAGHIPGAIKKGKQWLLPRSVLRSQGVNV